MTSTTADPMRVWIGSLSDYNAGRLHGEWVDVTSDPDELWAAIRRVLASSPEAREFPQGGPAEEWAFMDHEGFAPYRPGEYESVEKLCAIVEQVEEHGPAFLAWLSHEDHEPDEFDRFEDERLGEWDSVRAYVEDLVDNCGLPGLPPTVDIPKQSAPWETEPLNIAETLSSYLDWDALERDLFTHGTEYAVDSGNGTVYIFDPER